MRADPVNKWEIFNAITDCRSMLGVNDRTLSVLHALLTFRPGLTLEADECLVVFPSNLRLTRRAHGMPESTLRRHLAKLVEVGLIVRRDSPNGKRYVRGRGQNFDRNAFGFDLRPIVVRAHSFLAMAREVQAQLSERKSLEEQITVLRRDIGKLLTSVNPSTQALEILRARLSTLPIRHGKRTTINELRARFARLSELQDDVLSLLPEPVETDETSADDAQNERHIQESKTTELLYDSEIDDETRDPSSNAPTATPPSSLTLSTVLNACPDITDYSRDSISSWQALLRTAALVRCYLAIPTDAWEEAQNVLNPFVASIVVAAMLQRSDSIKTPGAYLRTLTKKASQGQFSPAPMLMSLVKTRRRSEKPPHQTTPPNPRPTLFVNPPTQVSRAIIPRLEAKPWQSPSARPPT